jgi:hypothetical protein
MFDFWKYRLWRFQLKRQIAKLDKKAGFTFKHAEIQSIGEAVARHREMREYLELQIEALEADRLQKRAAQFGLYELPPREAYEPKTEGVAGFYYFLPHHKERLYRMIADARFNWWKKWIDIISPVASVIISLLAFALAALALYLQITKRI